eukprot:jgi/Mesvir1/19021/Mv25358-RA.1
MQFVACIPRTREPPRWGANHGVCPFCLSIILNSTCNEDGPWSVQQSESLVSTTDRATACMKKRLWDSSSRLLERKEKKMESLGRIPGIETASWCGRSLPG